MLIGDNGYCTCRAKLFAFIVQVSFLVLGEINTRVQFIETLQVHSVRHSIIYFYYVSSKT